MNVELGKPFSQGGINNPITSGLNQLKQTGSDLYWNVIGKAYKVDYMTGSWFKEAVQRVEDRMRENFEETVTEIRSNFNRTRRKSLILAVLAIPAIACNLPSWFQGASKSLEFQRSEFGQRNSGSLKIGVSGNKGDGTACNISRGSEVHFKGYDPKTGMLKISSFVHKKMSGEEKKELRCFASVHQSNVEILIPFINENP